MKIRSITYFCNPQWPLNERVLQQAGKFITAARTAYEAAGYEVEVTRLATIPFPHLVPSVEVQQLLDLAQTLERTAIDLGYEYVALGPAFPDTLRSYEVIPDILSATEVCFLGGMLTTPGGGVSLPAVKACADIIHRTTPLSPNGFTNLRFGAIANVLPGGPFLPAAYHVGGEARFALATESADLAVNAFTYATSLEGARQALIEAVESNARNLERVAHDLAAFGAEFGGLDFTLAPFPEEDRSFGTAMERMGVPAVGMHGSLAAAAIITDTLDRAQYPRAGFNGLMLPVLEDTILAKRTAEGVLTVKDLLMYSAVCGTGLDTVPLPGDTSQGQLAAILLDIAALAQRLDKPLIARLMPVPGKAAGDPTDFDFPYFINGRILKVDAEPLRGLLTGDETFSLKARK